MSTNIRCPAGHEVADSDLRLAAGTVTITDNETGKSRTDRRVTGLVAVCPACDLRTEYPIPAPYVGRVVVEPRFEWRGDKLHRKGTR